jgi:hypothetical protein
LLSSCVKNMRSNARRWGYVVYIMSMYWLCNCNRIVTN